MAGWDKNLICYSECSSRSTQHFKMKSKVGHGKRRDTSQRHKTLFKTISPRLSRMGKNCWQNARPRVERARLTWRSNDVRRAATATSKESRGNKTRDSEVRRLAGVEATVTVDETETDTRGKTDALEETLWDGDRC